MPRLTDKSFVYQPSFATDLKAKFKRMRAQQTREARLEAERIKAEKAEKVQPIKVRK